MAGIQLAGAIEALYDEMDRSGILTSENTTLVYLMYRVRRELAKDMNYPNADKNIEFWQSKIDQLGATGNKFGEWIAEVDRQFGEDGLSEEAKAEFANYFLQGLTPSEAIQQDRLDQVV